MAVSWAKKAGPPRSVALSPAQQTGRPNAVAPAAEDHRCLSTGHPLVSVCLVQEHEEWSPPRALAPGRALAAFPGR